MFQRIISSFFNRLIKSWSWIAVILLSILIKWATWFPDAVEKYYTYGIYPLIGKMLRFIFGWIPFSMGDIFYALLGWMLVSRIFRFFVKAFKKEFTRKTLTASLQKGIFFLLTTYVLFNLLWGLNYDRRGIAHQLEMEIQPYSLQDLDTLTRALIKKANYFANSFTPEQERQMTNKAFLFSQATEAYKIAATEYPFLQYQPASIKPSLFSYAGNYLGFLGYYNPFSGEAQVNTTTPSVCFPFVAVHEIAHQIGYARENEANMAGYLAARKSPNTFLQYTYYFDMLGYALNELGKRDTASAAAGIRQLSTRILEDRKEYRTFFEQRKNPMEKAVSWWYGHFLKANNQPSGKDSYNEVVAWLIAYYKKYGIEAI